MFGGGFPFGGMAPERPRKPVDTNAFYELLGITKSATTEEIKRAFKRLAIKHHPDKGGDQEKFKEICKAYEVLSDSEKRATYDQYGEEGLEGAGQGDPSDIFDMFFGGGRRQGPSRGDDVMSEIKWTLEQFFNGATKKMAITKNVICSDCKGEGGQPQHFRECKECNGNGIKVIIRRMGPIFSQSQTPCEACKRTGKVIADDKKCKKCIGRGLVKERKTLELVLDKGAPEGHKIIFRGEADEKPGEIAGDVVFICFLAPHPVFTRKGVDLIMERHVTLLEALTGVNFSVMSLDKRILRVATSPGDIIKPNDILAVVDEGMPKHGQPFVRGNMYIKFTVDFPTAPFNEAQRRLLLSVLPNPAAQKPIADEEMYEIEEHELRRVEMPSHSNQRQEEDDEEDGRQGQPGVQCRQA